MSTTIQYGGQLVVEVCWCGMRHAVPSELADFQRRQFDNGQAVKPIYCPLGHTHVPAGQGEAERLRKSLERERNRAASLTARLDQSEASRRAQKAATTRAKKRAAAGVCPCCNRTFKQLARHMESQHPDYASEGDR